MRGHAGLVINKLSGELIDYTTSMITHEDPLQGYLCYWDLDFSPTLSDPGLTSGWSNEILVREKV